MVCVRLAAPLSEDDARALASMIGPVKDPVGRTRDGGQLRYSDERQIIDAGFVLTDELRAQLGDLSFGGDSMRPGLFETFHTDDTYTERPALATVLHRARASVRPGRRHAVHRHARRVPAARRADARLDCSGCARCTPTTTAARSRRGYPPRGRSRQLVDVVHPIVRAHPVTGEPALYFDLDRATHVEGMPDDEGRALLQSLQDHAEQRAPRYAHAWQPHDVLIWDNASVQHKASGDFPVGEPRHFWRYMIDGPAPVPMSEGAS